MRRTVLIFCLSVSFHALAETPCIHLGEDVVCPAGITPGSESVTFTPGGILWSDGNESVGQNPPPFVDMPGASPGLSPGSGAGLQAGSQDVTAGEQLALDVTVEEQLALTADPGGETIRPRRRSTSFEWPDEVVIVDLVMTHTSEELAREFAAGDADKRRQIREMLYLPDYIDDSPAPGSREAILDKYRETGDLAGAGAALADGSIKYDQATRESVGRTAVQVGGDENSATTQDVKTRLQNQFVGMAPNDQVIFTTRGNCYEFVHLAAYFAGAGRGPVNTETGVDNLIDKSTREIWDGSSDIPAGKIVIGTVWNNTLQGGQDEYGFFHVGISLGDGRVVSNRGSGAQIESSARLFWRLRWLRPARRHAGISGP
jgi:hypothetical protein